jgi:hypothetical protein
MLEAYLRDCLYVHAAVLLLTIISLVHVGNAHTVGKKSPINLTKDPTGKIAVVSKSSSPPPDRPLTAIDPLSHVSLKEALALQVRAIAIKRLYPL